MSTATNTHYDFLTLRSVDRVPNVLSDVSEAVQSQYSHSPQVKKFADLLHNEISGEPFSEFLTKNFFFVDTASGIGLDTLADRVGVTRTAVFSDGSKYRLTDDELRLLVKFKARANIGDATLASMQEGLDLIYDGAVKLIDNQNMTITVVIESALSRVQRWILLNYGLAQRGGGVGVIIQGSFEVLFGFRYSGLEGFNVGVFNHPIEMKVTSGN